MTVLATKVETSAPKAQKSGAFWANATSSFGSGIALAVLAPLLFPLAVLAGATVAAGRSVGAWLTVGRSERPSSSSANSSAQAPPGGENPAWPRGGSGFPQKIPQKIFGASHPWRLF